MRQIAASVGAEAACSRVACRAALGAQGSKGCGLFRRRGRERARGLPSLLCHPLSPSLSRAKTHVGHVVRQAEDAVGRSGLGGRAHGRGGGRLSAHAHDARRRRGDAHEQGGGAHRRRRRRRARGAGSACAGGARARDWTGARQYRRGSARARGAAMQGRAGRAGAQVFRASSLKTSSVLCKQLTRRGGPAALHCSARFVQ